MKGIALALGAALILSAPAAASNWVHIGNGSAGTRVFVDTASISGTFPLFRVWVQYIGGANPPPMASEKDYMLLNCTARTTSTISWITYRVNGTVIKSGTIPESIIGFQAEPAAPDTIADMILTKACNGLAL